jgi:phosphoribosylformylglycinamidine synthase
LGIIDDVRLAQTTDFKNEGDLIYLLGTTGWELGGSMLEYLTDQDFGPSPRLFPREARKLYKALASVIKKGLVASCHDLSDGGLALALAESALGGRLGAAVEIDRIPMRLYKPEGAQGGVQAWEPGPAQAGAPDVVPNEVQGEAPAGTASSDSPSRNESLVRLFAESPSRFLVSVRPEDRKAFESALAGQAHTLIGRVRGEIESDPLLTVQYKEEVLISGQLSELEKAFYSFAAGAGA